MRYIIVSAYNLNPEDKQQALEGAMVMKGIQGNGMVLPYQEAVAYRDALSAALARDDMPMGKPTHIIFGFEVKDSHAIPTWEQMFGSN